MVCMIQFLLILSDIVVAFDRLGSTDLLRDEGVHDVADEFMQSLKTNLLPFG